MPRYFSNRRNLTIRMRILLTGFEPFGKVKINPSEQIVDSIAMRDRNLRGADLVTDILPTEFRAAGNKIRRLIRSVHPSAVVCLGVAASRNAISLERVALNLDDEASPDNAGTVRIGWPIARHAPAAYWSTLPIEHMCAALGKRGIPVNISNHAGTYVCNHVFYVARHELEIMGRRTPCGLIHVPGVRKRGNSSKGPALALGEMVTAVESCLEILRKRKV